MDRYAVYVNTEQGLTFRVGQPVVWGRAMKRWNRIDNRRGGFEGVVARPVTVRHDGRRYKARSVEVRAVDRHGRGLGSERHTLAFPVPYRVMRSAVR